MDRLKGFVSGLVEFSKVLGVVVSCLGFISGALYVGAKAYAYWITRAGASELKVLEVKVENEVEWRHAEWQQLQEIARAVRAPVLSPPPTIGPVMPGKSDAPR